MSCVILTDSDGKMIDWNRQPWTSPGEYVYPEYHIVLVDIPLNQEPVAVTALGPATTENFATPLAEISCPRVHRSAIVTLRDFPDTGGPA